MIWYLLYPLRGYVYHEFPSMTRHILKNILLSAHTTALHLHLHDVDVGAAAGVIRPFYIYVCEFLIVNAPVNFM